MLAILTVHGKIYSSLHVLQICGAQLPIHCGTPTVVFSCLELYLDRPDHQLEQVSKPAYHPIETAGHPAHPYTVDQGIHPDPADLDRPSAVAGGDAVAASQTAAADWAAAVGAD